MRTTAPATDRAPDPGTAPPTAAALDLDARLAAADATMTLRLEAAGLRHGVDAAAAETTVSLTDVVTGPVAAPEPAVVPYGTPAATTLQQAARLLRTAGWCRGATRDTGGARCLYGAVHTAAPDPRTERAAVDALMEAVRRRFRHLLDPSVPTVNDHHLVDGADAVRLLEDAASIADARGL